MRQEKRLKTKLIKIKQFVSEEMNLNQNKQEEKLENMLREGTWTWVRFVSSQFQFSPVGKPRRLLFVSLHADIFLFLSPGVRCCWF